MNDQAFLGAFEAYVAENGDERALKMLVKVMAAIAARSTGGFTATDDNLGVEIEVTVWDE